MIRLIQICFFWFVVGLGLSSASANTRQVILVVYENEDASQVMAQPYFKQLANQGMYLAHSKAITHPSQPNYIALTAGDVFSVTGDGKYDLNVSSIVDLLEAAQKDWRVYAEGYPGNCFRGGSLNSYARKHVPMISYTKVTSDPARCAKIVSAEQFSKDAAQGNLPAFTLYVPDLKNDGHDTGVKYADQALKKTFDSFLNSPQFGDDTLFIVTFDEGSYTGKNEVYTSITNRRIPRGTVIQDQVTHYSILRLIEDYLGIGNLGRKDQSAPVISLPF